LGLAEFPIEKENITFSSEGGGSLISGSPIGSPIGALIGALNVILTCSGQHQLTKFIEPPSHGGKDKHLLRNKDFTIASPSESSSSRCRKKDLQSAVTPPTSLPVVHNTDVIPDSVVIETIVRFRICHRNQDILYGHSHKERFVLKVDPEAIPIIGDGSAVLFAHSRGEHGIRLFKKINLRHCSLL